MADSITARVVGLPELSKRLRELSFDTQGKIARSGALAAGGIFRKGAVALAPELSKPDKRRRRGVLKKGIFAGRSRSKSKPGLEVVVVSVKAGKKSLKSGDPFYWRWVDQGHVARGPGQRIKGGKRTKALTRSRLVAEGKFVPGVHFFERSFASNQDKAVKAFNTRLSQRIAKANKDLNGR